MKRSIALGVLAVLLAFCFLFGCGSGGPQRIQPAGKEDEHQGFFIPRTPEEIRPLPEPEWNEPAGSLSIELGDEQIRLAGGLEPSFEYCLAQYLKSQVEQIWVHFYVPVGDSEWDYYGSSTFFPGVSSQTERLKAQTYQVRAITWNPSYKNSFYSEEMIFQVNPGPNPALKIVLKRYEDVTVPVRILNPPGNYIDGVYYELTDVPGFGFYSEAVYASAKKGMAGGSYLDCTLICYAPFYSPHEKGKIELTIIDSDNKERIMRGVWDPEKILVENPVLLPVEEVPTGDLAIDFQYEFEGGGKLTVSVSPESPPPFQTIPGTTNQRVYTVRLQADPVEDVEVHKIMQPIKAENRGAVGEVFELGTLRLFNGDVQIGNTIAGVWSLQDRICIIFNDLGLLIRRGEHIDLSLVVDFREDAFWGEVLLFECPLIVETVGLASGLDITEKTSYPSESVVNRVTLYPTKLSLVMDDVPGSNTGRVRNTFDTIARIWISNLGSRDANLESLGVKVFTPHNSLVGKPLKVRKPYGVSLTEVVIQEGITSVIFAESPVVPANSSIVLDFQADTTVMTENILAVQVESATWCCGVVTGIPVEGLPLEPQALVYTCSTCGAAGE